jgi:hypothetical protein
VCSGKGRARTIALATSAPSFPLRPLIDQIGECLFVGLIDQIGRCHARGLIHAHIQRSIRHERKPSVRRRELIPADPQIRQQPVHLLKSCLVHRIGQRTERAIVEADPVRPLSRVAPRHLERL